MSAISASIGGPLNDELGTTRLVAASIVMCNSAASCWSVRNSRLHLFDVVGSFARRLRYH
jgi:hypothetical protein